MTVCGERVTGICVMGKCPHIKRCFPVVWDKYGKIKPKTNEEWLRQANTEQLAEEIYNFVWCSSELWQQLCCNGDGTDEESDLRIVREWLKQPHTTKE